MYTIKKGLEKEYEEYVAKNQPDEEDTVGYGAAIIRYAQAWGEMMEQQMNEGAQLHEIWSQCSHDADTEGITGFMYGCAVKELTHYWVHGEALRIMHNAAYGHTGKGVVNPAVITIESNE